MLYSLQVCVKALQDMEDKFITVLIAYRPFILTISAKEQRAFQQLF